MDATQEQTPTFSPAQPEREDRPKHSGPGIASFILGLLSILAIIVSLVVMVAGLAEYATQEGLVIPDEEEIAANATVLVGALLYMLSLLLSIIGIVLGIVGCVIRNRRRVFAILGLVFSALVGFGTIVTFMLGLLVQSQA